VSLAYGQTLAIVATLIIGSYTVYGGLTWRRWDQGYFRLRVVQNKRENAISLLQRPVVEEHLRDLMPGQARDADGRGQWRKLCQGWLRASCTHLSRACERSDCGLFPCVAIRQSDSWWTSLRDAECRRQMESERAEQEYQAFLRIGCGDAGIADVVDKTAEGEVGRCSWLCRTRQQCTQEGMAASKLPVHVPVFFVALLALAGLIAVAASAIMQP